MKFQMAYANMLPHGEERNNILKTIKLGVEEFGMAGDKENEHPETPRKGFASLSGIEKEVSPLSSSTDMRTEPIILEVGDDGLYPELD